MKSCTKSNRGRVWFVSGIDTCVGKTVATGLMCRYLVSRGVDAITVKMVQTGCDGFSEDVDAHRRLCGMGTQPEDVEGLTAPQIFRYPSSPLLSARLEGRSVDLEKIAGCVAACAARREAVLVEGAGGMLVPLAENTLAADFAASQGWPLILVTCGRLGSINHTLLSLEAAAARGMHVAGVVFCWHPGVPPEIDADAEEETRRRMAGMGMAPVVVRVPRIPEVAGQGAGRLPDVDFAEVFA